MRSSRGVLKKILDKILWEISIYHNWYGLALIFLYIYTNVVVIISTCVSHQGYDRFHFLNGTHCYGSIVHYSWTQILLFETFHCCASFMLNRHCANAIFTPFFARCHFPPIHCLHLMHSTKYHLTVYVFREFRPNAHRLN